jgi:predicted secreted hydrolase
LTNADFTLSPVGAAFKAPSGAIYPIRWTARVPAHGLAIDVTTPLQNQELSTAGAGISYWEGAIDVAGTSRGNPIAGRGYLEMTGYKGSLGRVLSSQ